ncbi:MAG: hypothetical protein SV062_00250 [Thermodesulfobacteriota bacterium]|nr:hypothetical protein [Thermodesulfobacteriota bacterium]
MKWIKDSIIPIFIGLIGTISILIAGINSNIYLGDEVYHYRLAEQIYTTKTRPIYDPLIHSTEKNQRKFMVAILWHTLLAGIWILTGKASQLTAQIYQALYYFLLVFFTYLLSFKYFKDKKTAVISTILVSTIPMFGAYSTMLYLDIGISFLTVLGFLLFFKERYFWQGVVLALMFLEKRNGYFFLPIFILCILLFTQTSFKKRITNIFFLLLPLIILTLPDIYFRYVKLGSITFHPPPLNHPPYSNNFSNFIFIHPESWSYSPSNFIKYLGIPFYISLFFYIYYCLKRKIKYKDDMIFLISSFVYLGFYLYFFKNNLSMRYLCPIIPVVCIFMSRGIYVFVFKNQTKKFNLTFIILILGVIQFFSAIGYVYTQRKIPEEVWQAYNFIEENTSSQARFMAVRPALSLYTGRKSIWHSDASLHELGYLFWKANDKEVKEILHYNKIDYLFVDTDRIHDDSEIKDIKHYPLSFIKKLYKFSFLKLVFNNKSVHIWKINE